MRFEKPKGESYYIRTSLFEVSFDVDWKSWGFGWFSWGLYLHSINFGPCWAVIRFWRRKCRKY